MELGYLSSNHENVSKDMVDNLTFFVRYTYFDDNRISNQPSIKDTIYICSCLCLQEIEKILDSTVSSFVRRRSHQYWESLFSLDRLWLSFSLCLHLITLLKAHRSEDNYHYSKAETIINRREFE